MNPEKTSDQLAEDIRAIEAAQKPPEEEEKEQEKQEEDIQGDDKKEEDNKKEEGEGEEEDDDKDFTTFEEIKKEKKEKEEKKVEDEDNDLSDEDKKLLDKRVSDKLEEYKAEQEAKQEAKEKREQKWNKYMSENPHYAKYSDQFKPYMHRIYDTLVSNGIDGIKIPESRAMDAIMGMMLGKGMLKIGARMAREADGKASAASQSGGAARKNDTNKAGIPDVKNMSSEDFKKLENQVMNGQFKIA